MKKNPYTHSFSRIHRQRGFALVATLTLLSLMSLIAIGLLSLSSIESRRSGLGSKQDEARANARLALMVAIAELQKTLGPDQAISAPAALLDSDGDTPTIDGVNYPHLTGVWRSRVVENGNAFRPETLNDFPQYDRETPFLRWLISDKAANDPTENLDFAQTGNLTDPVKVAELPELNSENPEIKRDIFAGRVPVETGAYAWWIADEGVKARINLTNRSDRSGGNSSRADQLAGFATRGVNGPLVTSEFANFQPNTTEVEKLLSMDSLELLQGLTITEPSEVSSDVTIFSESVLANVVDGALREDLSLYLERDLDWDQAWGASGRGAPTAPLGPDGKIALSPPDEFDVLPWKTLHHYYNQYRNVNISGSSVTSVAKNANARANPVTNPPWNQAVRALSPVVTQIKMLLSYSTEARNGGRFDLKFHAFPVLTLWNPYNVPMDVNNLNIWLHTLPLEHDIDVDGLRIPFQWRFSGDSAGTTVLNVSQASDVTLAPGEAMNLYPRVARVDRNRFNIYEMTSQEIPWSTAQAGPARPVRANIQRPATSSIRIGTEASTWETSNSSHAGLGFQSTFGFRAEANENHFNGNNFREHLFSSQVCWRREDVNPSAAQVSQANFPASTIQDVLDAPRPFMVVDIRFKTLDEIDLPNKPWIHTIPSHSFAAATSTQRHGATGIGNSQTFFAHPYSVNFQQVFTEEGIFNRTARFGSSNTTSGQTAIIDREIPLVPLTSLAQLQNLPLIPMEGLNWSGYFFQNKAIGNSYASPGLSPTEIRRESFPFWLGQYFSWEGGDLAGRRFSNVRAFNGDGFTPTGAPPLIVDRSYAANHLLFDRYFFSSIAPQDNAFYGRFGDGRRDLKEVFEDFVNGDRELPNASYKFMSSTEPSELVGDLMPSQDEPSEDAYRQIAAHLLTEGGFNINSTSVKAWSIMLASAHLKRPVTIADSGTVSSDADGEYVVSRFTTVNSDALDSEENGSKWLGYRELTQEQIEELARAIVKQVKLRGPFRSLGEFVNRRRSDNTDLAKVGALQAALDDDDVTINDAFSGNSITGGQVAAANYPFPEAATGSSYEGTPNYVTQADILTPIAPVINARSDTFTIRAYGESSGSEQSKARAWCEAVVQRTPNYIDPLDEAWVKAADLQSETNKTFGRQFVIKSFRWLDKEEL